MVSFRKIIRKIARDPKQGEDTEEECLGMTEEHDYEEINDNMAAGITRQRIYAEEDNGDEHMDW